MEINKMNKTYIEKIYCTREALHAIEDYEFCGMPIKPATLEFLSGNPQMFASNSCPFRLLLSRNLCIVFMPDEPFPLKAILLASKTGSKWHYEEKKSFLQIEWHEEKKKKHHRDTISTRFFS